MKVEPVKSEPESAPVKTEIEQYDPEQLGDDFQIKTEPDQAPEGMAGVQNVQEEHTEDSDRPIGIKEDGYV